MTFELKSLILVFVEMVLSLHILSRVLNAALPSATLDLASAAVPPEWSITLPRYVKFSTTSRGFPPTVIACVSSVLILSIFDFPGCIRSLIDPDSWFTVEVLSCIWLWLCETRAMSSAKSRSSSWVHNVH